MTPTDESRQRKLLARLEMLTEELRTLRVQARADAVEPRGATGGPGDRIPLLELLDRRDAVVTARERARAARDRWRDERDRLAALIDSATDESKSEIHAAHVSAADDTARLTREFHRLGEESARLTRLVFDAANADSPTQDRREPAQGLLRADAKAQSLVDAAQTPDLLRVLRELLLSRLREKAGQLRSPVTPTPELRETTTELVEALEDVNAHRDALSPDTDATPVDTSGFGAVQPDPRNGAAPFADFEQAAQKRCAPVRHTERATEQPAGIFDRPHRRIRFRRTDAGR